MTWFWNNPLACRSFEQMNQFKDYIAFVLWFSIKYFLITDLVNFTSILSCLCNWKSICLMANICFESLKFVFWMGLNLLQDWWRLNPKDSGFIKIKKNASLEPSFNELFPFAQLTYLNIEKKTWAHWSVKMKENWFFYTLQVCIKKHILWLHFNVFSFASFLKGVRWMNVPILFHKVQGNALEQSLNIIRIASRKFSLLSRSSWYEAPRKRKIKNYIEHCSLLSASLPCVGFLPVSK